ncbi:MAG: glycosyl transferase family 28 [Rhizobacter sp.]|nr:glycosyl transferase family 28 [Ferruginibacter sp.]
MNGENINIEAKPLRVLISPLDWGLGHATRIITIVEILQKYDVQVLIAAEGAAALLLQTEFPGIKILSLKGYRVRYSRSKKNFIFKLAGQLPGIFASIKRENRWLKKVVMDHKIDAVISDNRFGFYHRSIPSVYITHQLFIETGKKWMNDLAQKIHYKYINRFTECWVPDFEEGITLAGKLSHPEKLPNVPVSYLGPLSRFKKEKENISDQLLIILSGPEPQRTIWEKEILQQVKKIPGSVILVRGLPGNDEKIAAPANLTIYNHIPARELNTLILRSAVILSRSGYSTVMDLFALQKAALLVPTPGQSEQEYLADYLHLDQHLFYSCRQHEMKWENIFMLAGDFLENRPVEDYLSLNEQVIKKWIRSLRASK